MVAQLVKLLEWLWLICIISLHMFLSLLTLFAIPVSKKTFTNTCWCNVYDDMKYWDYCETSACLKIMSKTARITLYACHSFLFRFFCCCWNGISLWAPGWFFLYKVYKCAQPCLVSAHILTRIWSQEVVTHFNRSTLEVEAGRSWFQDSQDCTKKILFSTSPPHKRKILKLTWIWR